MRLKNLFATKKRLLAAGLSVVLTIGLLFSISPAALNAQATAGFDRTADFSTLENWKNYYGSGATTTANAGKIWTDKTVLDGNAQLDNGIQIARSSSDNFLVGLSALSSVKSLSGHDTIPTDVIFVLDISSSMRTTANQGAISAMVDAANESMDTLLENNADSRVGVILYDQNPFILLPLDRYLHNNNAPFLAVDPASREKTITADAIGIGGPFFNTVTATSGTFTQGGFQLALNEFKRVTNNTAGGPYSQNDTHIPAIIFMSDGSPTISNTYYTDVLDYPAPPNPPTAKLPTLKNGSGTVGIAFTTQLSISYTRAQMDAFYAHTPLFYSLGFGLDNLSGNTGILAKAVLDPNFSTAGLDDYWDEFWELNANEEMSVINTSTRYFVTRVEDGLESLKPSDNSSRTAQYMDEFFAAEDEGKLGEIFADIIEEIQLQSKAYPTYTGGDNADLAGYLNFKDVIGEYMEITTVNGLAYEGEMFDGASFAKAIIDAKNSGGNGDTDNQETGGTVHEAGIPLDLAVSPFFAGADTGSSESAGSSSSASTSDSESSGSADVDSSTSTSDDLPGTGSSLAETGGTASILALAAVNSIADTSDSNPASQNSNTSSAANDSNVATESAATSTSDSISSESTGSGTSIDSAANTSPDISSSVPGSADNAAAPAMAPPAVFAAAPTVYANDLYEFIKSVAVRLNISVDEATNLVHHAVDDGQIYYNSPTDYGNMVLWYGNDDDGYIAPALQTGGVIPTGATVLNRSYGFFREEPETGKAGQDLMYIGVRARTVLATGNQTMVFTVPASMVPVVEYDITLDGESEDASENATMEKTPALPISLFYEVGLRSDITEENLYSKIRADYPYKTGDTYTFYTNTWQETAANTVVTFTPAVENSYYYYPDTPLYEYVGGEYVQATSSQPNGTYYTKSAVYDETTPDTPVPINWVYTEIPAETYNDVLSVASAPYLPAGTDVVAPFAELLAKNASNTSTYNNVLFTQPREHEGKVTSAVAQLGNNGLLMLQQKFGNLSVEKKVGGATGETNKDFDFAVTLSDPAINGTYGGMSFTNGVAVFALKHGETITATALPAGVGYTVTEASYSADGYTTSAANTTGTIVADSTVTATFTNTKNTAPVSSSSASSGEPVAPIQTGDSTNIVLWIILAGVFALGLAISVVFFIRNRNASRNNKQ